MRYLNSDSITYLGDDAYGSRQFIKPLARKKL